MISSDAARVPDVQHVSYRPSRDDRDATIVWLRGEHDVATASEDAHRLAGAMEGRTDVIVDLSGVTFIGAATLGVFVRAQDVLRRGSRNLTLRSPSPIAQRVLGVCGLDYSVSA